jgi:RNase P subunit RPR2
MLMERKHLCPRCQALLAIERSDQIFIRYKERHWMVKGTVTTNCHRCKEICVIVISDSKPTCTDSDQKKDLTVLL